MSITTLQRTINRTIIDTSLQGLRLPLTAVERVTGHQDDDTWAPAIAFESFEANTKKVLGSLLRDDELLQEGRLKAAKVKQLSEAERLETEADVRREQADAQLRARQEEAQRAREKAEKQAEEREAKIRREAEQKKAAADEEARRREADLAKAEELRGRVVATQERAARRTRVNAEATALEDKHEALGKVATAEVLEDALEKKRAQRKR